MGYVVFVVGTLGALSSGYLGNRWRNDYLAVQDKVELVRRFGQLGLVEDPERFRQAEADVDRALNTYPFLLAGLPLGFAGAVLGLLRWAKSGAALLLVAGAGPGLLIPKTLVFTWPLLVAGLLGFLVRPKRPATTVPAGTEESPSQVSKRPTKKAIVNWIGVLVGVVVLADLALLSGAYFDVFPKSSPAPGQAGGPPVDMIPFPEQAGKGQVSVGELNLPSRNSAEENATTAERDKRRLALRTAEQERVEALDKTAAARDSTGLEFASLGKEPPGYLCMINALAFSPDGQLLASTRLEGKGGLPQNRTTGSLYWSTYEGEGFVQLWDLRTGTRKHLLPGHTSPVRALAFAPDGRTLASGDDRAIRIWDVRTGQLQRTLTGFTTPVLALAYSTTGSLLASGTITEPSGRTLKFWNPDTGEEIPRIPAGQGVITYLAFRPDGKSVVAHSDKGLQVWETATGKQYRITPPKKLRGGDKIALSPDGWSLAMIDSFDPILRLYDLETGEKWESKANTRDKIEAIAFSSNGKLVISSGKDVLQVWDVATGKELHRVPTSGLLGVGWLAFSPGDIWLAGHDSTRTFLFTVADLTNEPLNQAIQEIRKVAEVIRMGKSYRIKLRYDQNDDKALSGLQRLPGIVELDLEYKDRVTDDGLVHVTKLNALQTLNLSGASRITDQGLAHLKALPNLRSVNLGGLRRVTDAGLAQLAGKTELTTLGLRETGVTKAGLVHLKGLTKLKALNLEYVRIEDAGLAELEGVGGLTDLNLAKSGITDGGLAHLRKMNGMVVLNLAGNRITGSGLVHLKGMTNLQELNLHETQVGDAGLSYLQGLRRLTKLDLGETPVTDAGFEPLAGLTALTELKVPNQEGFSGAGLKHLKKASGLATLALAYTQVTDAGLEGIRDWTQLRSLSLPKGVTDAGFVHLAGLTHLTELKLAGLPKLQGPGLKHLAKMTNLTTLDLKETGVTDAGLEGLKGLTQLKKLMLPPQISDAGLVHLQGLVNLEWLELTKTKVTDDGLKALTGLSKLGDLSVGGTQVTKNGEEMLKKAIPHVYVRR